MSISRAGMDILLIGHSFRRPTARWLPRVWATWDTTDSPRSTFRNPFSCKHTRQRAWHSNTIAIGMPPGTSLGNTSAWSHRWTPPSWCLAVPRSWRMTVPWGKAPPFFLGELQTGGRGLAQINRWCSLKYGGVQWTVLSCSKCQAFEALFWDRNFALCNRRHVHFTGDSDGVVINNDTWLRWLPWPINAFSLTCHVLALPAHRFGFGKNLP